MEPGRRLRRWSDQGERRHEGKGDTDKREEEGLRRVGLRGGGIEGGETGVFGVE